MEATSTHPIPVDVHYSFARAPHFQQTLEDAINDQINIEYNVSYIYHSMYAFFSRDNVALDGFAQHFKKESLEERSHAELLMDYQTKRGVKYLSRLLCHLSLSLSMPRRAVGFMH